jgi:hypothetical protein
MLEDQNKNFDGDDAMGASDDALDEDDGALCLLFSLLSPLSTRMPQHSKMRARMKLTLTNTNNTKTCTSDDMPNFGAVVSPELRNKTASTTEAEEAQEKKRRLSGPGHSTREG